MKRAKHSLSNYKLFTGNMGEIIPCGLTEVLPGDTFQHSTHAFVRCAPLLAPVMHPVDIKIHHWFVPHRLIWDDWENFITAGPNGTDASVHPTITTPASVGFPVGSLADYLGVPTGVPNLEVSALPFRGYALIFNEYYRDQDLVTPLTIDTTSGPDTTTNTTIKNAAWEKDYFTSARTTEQKGPTISIPLTGNAPVTLSRVSNAPLTQVFQAGTNSVATNGNLSNAAGVLQIGAQNVSLGVQQSLSGVADLSGVSAVDMLDLRLALALQRFEEARSIYGSRYVEYLRYLGVKSSDARLQRPEYLGGGKQTIQFSEVLQTAEGTDPVGEMRGHGIASMRSNRYRRFFEEHGFVFSFFIARPKTIYADGLYRHWNRRTRNDYYQRELEHIGQQSILNKEVYAANASPNGVFGYQDRYDEYRRQESSVSGEFRTTLNYWHLAQLYASTPALNASFITSVPSPRIFAATGSDQLYVLAKHSIQARRLVSQSAKSYIY